MLNIPRTVTIRAVTHCDLMVLFHCRSAWCWTFPAQWLSVPLLTVISWCCFIADQPDVEHSPHSDYPCSYPLWSHGVVSLQISLMLNIPRTVTIRAATHCDLMVLERHDLQAVFHQYPKGNIQKLNDKVKQINTYKTMQTHRVTIPFHPV